MPGQLIHQPSERLLTREDHTAATLPDQGRIADELERIPQPMIGIQQDRSPVEWSSVPDRLPEGGYRKLLALQPPLILGPSLLEVAHLEPAQCPAQVNLGMVGLEEQCLVVTRRRLGQSSQRAERIPQVVVGVEIVRLEMESPSIAGHRFVELSLILKQIAEVAVSFGVVRLDVKGPPQAGLRFVDPSLSLERDPQVVQGFGDDRARGGATCS